MLNYIGGNHDSDNDGYQYTLICMTTSQEKKEKIIEEEYDYLKESFEFGGLDNFIDRFKNNGSCKIIKNIACGTNEYNNIIQFSIDITKLNLMGQSVTITKFEPCKLLFEEQVIPEDTKYIYELYDNDLYIYLYEN